ncbi:hypothetical protein SAMN05518849_101576 [Sphingobium sp. AP50]|uniref:hypothetical protein n=1 Tax=Sphingobium sp. AP50 TaxID=1884369 RepID=UPI0008BCCEED|nr:hypothetical protein [Sphingobium sp. AP50]SEI69246.1 hypothetical protein SAMN05518849_101576 [Sphingobium sp. AP50]
MGAITLSGLEALLGPLVNIGEGDFPPIATPILHTDRGTVFVPHGHYVGRSAELRLLRGVGLAWAPCPEADGALLVFSGGNPAEPTDEAIAVTLSRAGIRALIASFDAIDRQLGEQD